MASLATLRSTDNRAIDSGTVRQWTVTVALYSVQIENAKSARTRIPG
jgi:hypothetical protein